MNVAAMFTPSQEKFIPFWPPKREEKGMERGQGKFCALVAPHILLYLIFQGKRNIPVSTASLENGFVLIGFRFPKNI